MSGVSFAAIHGKRLFDRLIYVDVRLAEDPFRGALASTRTPSWLSSRCAGEADAAGSLIYHCIRFRTCSGPFIAGFSYIPSKVTRGTGYERCSLVRVHQWRRIHPRNFIFPTVCLWFFNPSFFKNNNCNYCNEILLILAKRNKFSQRS